MTSKRHRKKIARQLPPVGTTLTATHKGQPHTAVIVEAKDRPVGSSGTRLRPASSRRRCPRLASHQVRHGLVLALSGRPEPRSTVTARQHVDSFPISLRFGPTSLDFLARQSVHVRTRGTLYQVSEA
jgi:hypothetical protein